MKETNLAIVGASGVVGNTFLKILENGNIKIKNLYLFASKRSAGKKVLFNGNDYFIEELTDSSFDRDIDIALFSAGGDISKKFAPIAVENGCIVIDNSSAWRMDKDVPLVVPEVNPEDILLNKGIIANPNCSTIQAVVALKPLHDKYKIKRIVYSTYQAVSGAGSQAMADLLDGVKGEPPKKFAHPIAGNCIPQIDVFESNGYTKEEMKMINETRKILHNPDMPITATAVRVPVLNAHSESINVEFENGFELSDVIETLKNAKGITVQHDPEKNFYPMPIFASDKDDVFVGRIRRDESVKNGINLWVVADNLKKGAALNAIQIAEHLTK